MDNWFGSPPKIVRHVGDLNMVEADGKKFYRQEFIPMYMDGMDKPPVKVKCAPYDNHFIYKDMRRHSWTTFCTCGSPAVVVGFDVYKKDASAQGAMLVCLFHASERENPKYSFTHADGSS